MVRALSTILLALATLACCPRRACAQDEVLTLGRAIELGRQRSPLLKSARAQIDGAEAGADLARAAHYPTVSASVSGQGSAARDTYPVAPPATGIFTAVSYSTAAVGAASLRWTLLDFGRTSNAVDAAEARRRVADSSAEYQELAVAGEISAAYVDLVYKDEIKNVVKATVQQREKLVVIARGLVKSGLQPPLEELRAASRVEAARRDLARAEADLLDARTTLAALLGLDPTSTLRVTIPRLVRPRIDGKSALAQAGKHPSVIAAAAESESRGAAADAASARYLPAVSLNVDGAYRFSRFDRSDAITTTRSATAALVVTVPIFDGTIGANVSVARADAANAEAQEEQTRRTVNTEAARAVVAEAAGATTLEHARAAAEAAAQVLALVEARYLHGLSSPLELIDAESADADARLTRVLAELSHRRSVVRLLVATGQKIAEEP